MKKLRFAFLSSLLLSCSAYADIFLYNHTDFAGSAYVAFSPCSSSQGEDGILQPHGYLVIPSSTLRLFCGFWSCNLHAYMTKDCSGEEVVTMKVSPSKGVLSIENHDPRFVFSGIGENVSIDMS